MASVEPQALDMPEECEPADVPVRKRRWRRVLRVAGVVLLIALAIAWFRREEIARDLITGQLEEMGLPAQYKIESIGVGQQVITNLVIGDPAHPDLTIERVEAEVETNWGIPGFGRITLVRPRLYGSYRAGKLSFGSLDKVLFAESEEPFRLPDLDLGIVDGRALLDAEQGPVGFKLEGEGDLRDGFAGELAAIAPKMAFNGCMAERASLYGKLTVSDEKPQFSGPLRAGSLVCPEAGLALASSAVQLDATIDQAFDGAEGKLGLGIGRTSWGDMRLAALTGQGSFTWRKQALTGRYDVKGSDVVSPQAVMATLGVEGSVRAQDGFGRIEVEGNVSGDGPRLGSGLDATLAGLERSSAETLAAPILARIRAGLRSEGQGSRLIANFILRQSGDATSLVVPQAVVRGGSGQALISLSRFQSTFGGGATPQLSGNFTTGGAGLPQIAGRMERAPGGPLQARLTLAEYAAGTARLSVPELLVTQKPGATEFTGSARLSGALPGGQIRNMIVPLQGRWSAGGGLAVWQGCTSVRFDGLSLANLTLDRRQVTLCPPPGDAILRSDSRGTRLAAGAPSLGLSGRLGTTPIRISSGPLGFALPGVLKARSLDVELGDSASPSRFRVANLSARIDRTVAGEFADSEVYLNAVPLDLVEARGNWSFAGGRLSITNGEFRLLDRELDDRFQPLVAQGATLDLIDNRITANAVMREPKSGREIVQTVISHDLRNGIGEAKLDAPGILFDRRLQPEQVSHLALGVVANAKGTVRGNGSIRWTPDKVDSDGIFTTDSFDFAAAFGPVKGLSGKVEFSDLLGIVTRPDQTLAIASINPGIEATDGKVVFELQPGHILQVKGASWPFMDGRLTLEPVRMALGTDEVRRYTLTIEGLDAARFVQRLDLGNIAATGVFDGSMPVVFDENGGRIEGGLLVSRPPGGNVSYVGQLTYQDMSPMANFAFDALKSIDYRTMRIEMNGALEGEIVTRVSFDGLSQGAAAKRNFVTRQLAKLPIRFNVNLRAPFLKLVTSFKSLYDPAYLRDPRQLGILGADGKPPIAPSGAPPQNVQPPVSESKP